MSSTSDPLASLFSLEQVGIKLGLDNIRVICDALGRPERSYETVIVAGTNGKGSVTAMVHAALSAAGLRAGRYTSPHLIRLEERFVVGNRAVATTTLRSVAAEVLAVVDELRRRGALLTLPTFFEVTTAIAFELFRRAEVTVAVLEVGLGGRFDATNIANPIAGAIVSIDLDHEQYLGRTIADIAFEKAGIIKQGMTLVVGERKPEVLALIAEACHQRGARLIRADDGVHARATMEAGRHVLDLSTPGARYGAIPLALRGTHQVANAVIAVRLLEVLSEAGIIVPPTSIAAGLSRVAWHGRLELIDDGHGRQVLLDAAHNPAGAAALAAYLNEAYPEKVPLVFAVMRDKDAAAMLRVLAASASHLILTRAPTARTADPRGLGEISQRVAPNLPIDIQPDPHEALIHAWRRAPTVCAAGSIFLVGALLERLRGPAAAIDERW